MPVRIHALAAAFALSAISQDALAQHLPAPLPAPSKTAWRTPETPTAGRDTLCCPSTPYSLSQTDRHGLASLAPTAAALESHSGLRVPGLPLWMAPVASALFPGAGQLQLGQDRFAAYAAVELYSWLQFVRHRRDGARARDRYRGLAAEIARSPFSASRPTGSFDYYETMESFLESGAFSAGTGGVVVPEADESTYNGFLWRRARDTFWEDPFEPPPAGSVAYQRALAYYEDRAVRDEYRWSWRNAQLEHDLFRQGISESNDSFRKSVRDMGIIIGNHLLSMVDAFATVRLQVVAPPSYSERYTIGASVPLGRQRSATPREPHRR